LYVCMYIGTAVGANIGYILVSEPFLFIFFLAVGLARWLAGWLTGQILEAIPGLFNGFAEDTVN